MASTRQIERVVRIRQLEEDESRRTLELALAGLAQLELALRAANQKERAGRSLVAASASSGEIADRIAGMEESRSASRLGLALASRIRAAGDAVALFRQDYLNKRTSRLQAETLAETERAREAAINLRRGQQALDDWYLNRLRLDEDRR
jgi:flagellar biosynthesis chaperone FliJ